MSALTDTVKGMSKANTGIVLIGALFLIIGFIVVALRSSTSSMSPLYTGLSLEDSAKIVAELDKDSTPYQILGNGSEILVPSDRVLRLRMSMAENGLPSGGSVVGYEIFDRSESFGSSNAVFNINVLRATEGELSRTIGSLADVDNARVQLVMPRNQLFTREKDTPSASVTVKMRGGRLLEHAEVIAIAHLVASAVPGLQVSRVTIVDSHGRLLARGDGDSASAALSNAEEMRRTYENRTGQDIQELLEKVIGTGKVRVEVSADMDFDRVVTNSEKYDPDGQVARSVQTVSGHDSTLEKTPKQSVSVANNLPPSLSGGDNGGSSNHTSDHSDETTNYEISKTVQNQITEGGKINKLSVAVLVDGTYANDKYIPRTDAEIKQLKMLVASAIGFDEKRGDKLEVVNMRFTQESFNVASESIFDRFKNEAQGIIQTLIIAIVAILAILLVLRPAVTQLIKQSQSATQRVTSELAALGNASSGVRLPGANMPEGGGGLNLPGMPSSENEMLIDVANIKGGMKSSSMRKINEIVEKYPEETMSVLRNWVSK